MPLKTTKPDEPVARVTVSRWRDNEFTWSQDDIAGESAIALVYNDISHAVMMATALDLEDFALGFSLGEQIIESKQDLRSIDLQYTDRGIEIQMSIPAGQFHALKLKKRSLAGVSGCGICGKESLTMLNVDPPPVTSEARITASTLVDAMTIFNYKQVLRAATGSHHGAAWCRADGSIIRLREDIGRHNAVDKLLGANARADEHPDNGFMILSSRISFEIVQKAARGNIAVIVAASAPTSYAISQAERANITLVGFVRENRFNVYSHADRIEANP